MLLWAWKPTRQPARSRGEATVTTAIGPSSDRTSASKASSPVAAPSPAPPGPGRDVTARSLPAGRPGRSPPRAVRGAGCGTPPRCGDPRARGGTPAPFRRPSPAEPQASDAGTGRAPAAGDLPTDPASLTTASAVRDARTGGTGQP